MINDSIIIDDNMNLFENIIDKYDINKKIEIKRYLSYHLKNKFNIDMEIDTNNQENIEFEKNSIPYKLMILYSNLNDANNKILKYRDSDNKDIDFTSEPENDINIKKNILNNMKQIGEVELERYLLDEMKSCRRNLTKKRINSLLDEKVKGVHKSDLISQNVEKIKEDKLYIYKKIYINDNDNKYTNYNVAIGLDNKHGNIKLCDILLDTESNKEFRKNHKFDINRF